MTTAANTKRNKKKTARLKRRADEAREALIKAAIYVLKGYGKGLPIDAIVMQMKVYDQGHTTARRLSAALRVARKDGRVVYDGKRYWVPVEEAKVEPTVPAWVREGQRVDGIGDHVGQSGALRRTPIGMWAVYAEGRAASLWIGDGDLVAKRWAPIPEPTVAPGAARDLAERQAFGTGTDAARWDPVFRTSPPTSCDVDPADERAPVPTGAAERIVALERRLEHAEHSVRNELAARVRAEKEVTEMRLQRDEAWHNVSVLREREDGLHRNIAKVMEEASQKTRIIRGLEFALAAMAERTDAQAAEKGRAA